MMKRNEMAVMKAIARCYKPYLKLEESIIYCDLGRTQLVKKLGEFGIYKNASGYYNNKDLDLMMSAGPSKIQETVNTLKL
jgi:hypothetical protein